MTLKASSAVSLLVLIYDGVCYIFFLISVNHARDKIAVRVWQENCVRFHKKCTEL